ncbi:dihydrolipoyl dehydrogenase family protein [Thalassobaculum litoreum]|uniref:Pyruvate/2-oxoglutarate dehydrogenase complex, dihydrolipoamide dehydrogenase (E3) component n=1 Tax=Thalassobaculum litoreum DSM 18839 TaxID=1123362 RepID=A0A8G2EUJ9_9PROT|nr:FAD-dependent oxidoreductase [Thalassobaculum litoreum]SDF41172.1 Pyruvate/2-oxoglutarate dehydrogenase complex, dihydrolipoamide dehydrogenase (E3) component [Thalassobaculum litoreum DSM 18839]
MSETIQADICVIGAGSGGLSVAAGASQMGASVVLFEKAEMGGDCLNVGCVPSKALLAAGHAAHGAPQAARYGVDASVQAVDWARLRAHVQGVIAEIAPMDSVARYTGFGVRVVQAEARFTGPRSVEGGGIRVEAKFVVIATGSTPAVPPIPGLDGVAFLTNETVFDLAERPRRLLVLGGGPIGCELAQAHARLGCEVVLVEAKTLLGTEDPEAAEVVRLALRRDGVELHEGAAAVHAGPTGDGVDLVVRGEAGETVLSGSHLLVAVGRRVGFEGLDLARAGIETDERGRLKLDRRLRTSNRRVFAVGDAAGGAQFTHLAGFHAGIVIRNALFRLPAKSDPVLPRVTYTAPELASVGADEAALRARGQAFEVLRWPFSENDRAIAERDVDGFTKLYVSPKGRILGAVVVGTGAGEIVSLYTLAIAKKLKVSDIAGLVVPYPTRAEVAKRAAGSWYVPKLFSARTRRIVRFLMRFA